jgi:hypothetical protein
VSAHRCAFATACAACKCQVCTLQSFDPHLSGGLCHQPGPTTCNGYTLTTRTLAQQNMQLVPGTFMETPAVQPMVRTQCMDVVQAIPDIMRYATQLENSTAVTHVALSFFHASSTFSTITYAGLRSSTSCKEQELECVAWRAKRHVRLKQQVSVQNSSSGCSMGRNTGDVQLPSTGQCILQASLGTGPPSQVLHAQMPTELSRAGTRAEPSQLPVHGSSKAQRTVTNIIPARRW